ncbi:conserved hypothetical protein [delta proteobacterium NaphS2]|nr:conserved hypothetical protein [delta proteobacterium NaphS2]
MAGSVHNDVEQDIHIYFGHDHPAQIHDHAVLVKLIFQCFHLFMGGCMAFFIHGMMLHNKNFFGNPADHS